MRRAATLRRTFLSLANLLVAGLVAGAPARPGGDEAEPPTRALVRDLCASPRLAGTTGSRWGAELVASRLQAAGWTVEIDSREVVLSLPRRIEVSIFGADGQALSERVERFDPDAVPPGDVPLCNAWAASGTVRARVVDAGHGLRADWERLAAQEVDVRGTIALVRYGRAYRGIKVDLAERAGCVGVLLFSEGDGPEKGAVWPEGPWKPDHEQQRGSILPIAKVPGDPSSPGWPSPRPGEEARRLSRAELDASLPKIPCVPIGAKEARLLLERLAPIEAARATGADAQSAADEPPRVGPGPVEARIVLEMPRDVRTIHNVIARLDGAGEDVVLAGGHRDAWVRGANDNASGTAVLVRAAQRLAERARAGWKPACGIVIALWDAEEFGLIGSTEWAEANAGWLRERAIAYLNLDASIAGTRFGGASGTPGMLGVLRDVLEAIPPAPRAAGEAAPASLWAEWVAALKEGAEPRLGLPGGGSDHAVFAHHLCVPVLEFGFGDARHGGYHTAFDDFPLVDRFLDPGFVGHELAARTASELIAELASRGRSACSPAEAARAFAARARELAADVRTPPELAAAAERVAAALDERAEARDAPPLHSAASLPQGLPGRAWFRNALWAPGLEDGYGSETFPGLREAAARGEAALAGEVDALLDRIGVPRDGAAGGR